MTGPMDLELLRLLRGELPPEEARRLRARLLEEPELAETYHRLERSWQSLELPRPSPVPQGFSTRVMARARQSAPGRDSWAAAPGWVRATAAAALVTGIVVGWAGAGVGRIGGIGGLDPVPVTTPEPAAVAPPIAGLTEEETLFDGDGDLADSYWEAVASLATLQTGETGEALP